MTDILCPVCGQLNPPEAKTCRACDAPLKTSAFTPEYADDSGTPEWLRELGVGQNASPDAGEALDQADFPDWLREIKEETENQQVSVPEAEPANGTPDWLADALKQTPSEPTPEEEPDWAEGWMAEVQSAAQPEAGEPGPEPEDYSLDDLTGPETPTEQEAQSVGEDGLLSTLSDWMAGMAAEQPEVSPAEDQPDLSPGELPGWLEAIRPTEVEGPSGPMEDVSGAMAENSGPLMGLRGVLSGEPLNIKAGRAAAAYSLKLRVTDEQKQRVTLLERLLAEEPKPKALPAAPIITAQYIFRLLITLILVLPVAWVVVKDDSVMPLPAASTVPGVMAVYQLIEDMPDQTPVLVAFDYEAGYSGEMDAAASEVVRHLMSRRAYLTLASTTATGPALAERFLYNLNQQTGDQGDPYSDYANLGYIPGGSIGLSSLASDLRQVLPYDLQGVDVWSGEALNSVYGLADFGMLLVLVNDPELARVWVEQTGPILRQDGTPLVMIASAQAAPLIQPYFAGYPQQVQGLVVGMAGGAAYENAVSAAGPALQAWDAFSIGLLASVVVILAGAALEVAVKAYLAGKKGK
jgi:hypothetical protein